jgi:NAD(P)-dependent dehydrogenase (short-subunit alcohol dehydrogenase family)
MDPRRAHAEPPFNAERKQSTPGHEGEMRHKPDFGENSYRGLGRLAGKRALITGGDSGIGRAVALAFAREGADVAIGYWQEHDDARETCRLIEGAGRRAAAIAGDIAEEAECRRTIDEAVERLGGIDVLVNNAAFQGKSVDSFEAIDAERVRRIFDVNIIAMFHMVRFALPHLRPGSAVINVASIQAYKPSAAIIDYAATKGAIVTFTKALAEALIERGIRANCVAPGPVWTPLIVQSFDQEKIEQFGKDSPMGRPAQPAELAPAFVFLASEEARYVNGEVLGVTGGKPLP